MRNMKISEIMKVNSLVNKTVKKMKNISRYEKFRIKLENNLAMIFLRKLTGEKIFVHEDNKKITGTIAVRGNLMGNLFVHPDFQKKGIGTRLLEKAESIISTKYKYAKFYSYRKAVDFHKKRGYEIKNKNLLMVKQL